VTAARLALDHPPAARTTAWSPPCTADPDRWHHRDGDHHQDWYWPAVAICRGCPVRRACIEGELARGRRPVAGSVWGGWAFLAGGEPRPHPADRDLYERRYPTKETR
jgi:hypothetical protein